MVSFNGTGEIEMIEPSRNLVRVDEGVEKTDKNGNPYWDMKLTVYKGDQLGKTVYKKFFWKPDSPTHSAKVVELCGAFNHQHGSDSNEEVDASALVGCCAWATVFSNDNGYLDAGEFGLADPSDVSDAPF